MGIFKDLKHFQYMIHIATGVWPPPPFNYEFYNFGMDHYVHGNFYPVYALDDQESRKWCSKDFIYFH